MPSVGVTASNNTPITIGDRTWTAQQIPLAILGQTQGFIATDTTSYSGMLYVGNSFPPAPPTGESYKYNHFMMSTGGAVAAYDFRYDINNNYSGTLKRYTGLFGSYRISKAVECGDIGSAKRLLVITGVTSTSSRVYYPSVLSEAWSYITLPATAIQYDAIWDRVNDRLVILGAASTSTTSSSRIFYVSNTNLYSSDDFTSIYPGTLVSSTPFSKFAFNQSSTNPVWLYFRLGTNNEVWRSTNADGTSPTLLSNLPATFSKSSVAYGNGKFVAIGPNTRIAYSSDNGVSWTLSDTTSIESQLGITTIDIDTYTQIIFGNGVFYILIPDGLSTRSFIFKSKDLINWEADEITSLFTVGGATRTLPFGSVSASFDDVTNAINFSVSVSEDSLTMPSSGASYPYGYVLRGERVPLIYGQPRPFY